MIFFIGIDIAVQKDKITGHQIQPIEKNFVEMVSVILLRIMEYVIMIARHAVMGNAIMGRFMQIAQDCSANQLLHIKIFIKHNRSKDGMV